MKNKFDDTDLQQSIIGTNGAVEEWNNFMLISLHDAGDKANEANAFDSIRAWFTDC